MVGRLLMPVRFIVGRAQGFALRKVCDHIGHMPSWRRAVELGITDRPVCAYCDAPLGAAESTNTDRKRADAQH